MRRVGAFVLSIVTIAALLSITGTAGATLQSVTDPVGDNGPSFNPHGDVTAFSVHYHNGLITFTINVATFASPKTSGAWVDYFSGPLFGIDTTGDDLPEYVAAIYNDGYGNVIGEIDTYPDFVYLCGVNPSWNSTDKSYTITFAATCIDTPAVIAVQAVFAYENATTFSLDDTEWVGPMGDAPEAPPSTPVNVQAVGGDASATVSWDPSTPNGADITGYSVLPEVSAQPGAVALAATPPRVDVGPDVNSVTVTGLTNGTSYTFSVWANSTAGASLPSAPSNAVTPTASPPTTTTTTTTTSTTTTSTTTTSTTTTSTTTTSLPTTTTTSTTTPPPPPPTTTTTSATTTTTLPPTTTTTTRPPHKSTASSGYWMLGRDGHVYGFGGAAAFAGSVANAAAIAPRTDGTGYWVVDTGGRVHAYGKASAFGSAPGLAAGESVTTISATPKGDGYWLFTNRGRVFAFGKAKSYGDMSKAVLNGPIVASTATATGNGYYLVGSDGGIFAFGDAAFHGSTGNLHLNKPVVGISPTPNGKGYWLVASDGGVFAFNAPFRGSMGGTQLSKPVDGLVAFGNGYLMVASDGGIFDFSNKPFYGSLPSRGIVPTAPIVGVAAFSIS